MLNQIKTKKDFTQEIGGLIDKFFGYLVIFIALMVLVAGYFILIRGEYFQLRQRERVDLVRAQSLLDGLQREDLQSRHIDETLEFTPAEERLISLALPHDFDLPSLIIQLNGMAKKNNFIIDGIEAKSSTVSDTKKIKAAASGQIKKTSLSIGLMGGNYDNFKSFLESLENSVMIFDTVSIDFSADASGQKYKLNLVTYYYN